MSDWTVSLLCLTSVANSISVIVLAYAIRHR